jgi:uncharacterized protein YuzE
MIFEYFPETDMLDVRWTNGASAESEEIAPGVVLDFDAANHLIGIEMEDAFSRLNLSRLKLRAVPVAQLIVTERTPATIQSARVRWGDSFTKPSNCLRPIFTILW